MSGQKTDIESLEKRVRLARTPKGKVDALIDLIFEIMRDDPQRGLELARQATGIAGTAGYRKGVAFGRKYEGLCSMFLARYDDALAAFNDALATFEELGETIQVGYVLAFIGNLHSQRGETREADALLRRSLAIADEQRDRQLAALSLHHFGINYSVSGEFSEAVGYEERALALHRELGSHIGLINTLEYISITYGRVGEYARALACASEAEKLCQRHGEVKLLLANCLMNTGGVYLLIGDYDKALDCFLRSLSTSDQAGYDSKRAHAFHNIALVYQQMKEYPTAIGYQWEAIDIYRAIGQSSDEAQALGSLGLMLVEHGEVDKALDLLLESQSIAKKIGAESTVLSTIQNIAGIYRHRGDIADAVNQYRTSLPIARRCGDRNAEGNALLALGEMAVEANEVAQGLEYLTAALSIITETGSKEHLHRIHDAFADAYRRRRRRDSVELDKAIEHYKTATRIREEILGIEKQKAMMALQVRYDVEKTNREKEILVMELEHKSKELAAMAIHLAEKNEIIESVRRQVNQAMNALHGTAKPLLRSLLMDLEHNNNGNTGWKEFEEQFQLVHGEFLAMLSKRWPVLTPTELKVCALLKLQLSSKEIGNFLKVTPRAVDKHRNAIRKKLELTSEMNLATYLAAM